MKTMQPHLDTGNITEYPDEGGAPLDEANTARPGILVHSCCGPCATAVVERLARTHSVTLFFYNPNITDEAEYKRRLLNQRLFVERYNLSGNSPDRLRLLIGPYEPQLFLKYVEGLESEPEGGARCEACFAMRLEKTAEYARLYGETEFTTTLTVRPHKNWETISRIGTALAIRFGLIYRADDYKKQDGFRRSVELAKAYDLYRQDYCGCAFSQSEAERTRK
jgi:predicted adenine nucleotide alpha hydrolase (AANH) superfamily ATPase